MKKIKILISTDSAGIHTGLGEGCRLVFTELLKNYPNEFEIHQLGWFHVTPTEQVPWPIYQTHVVNGPNGPSLDHEDRYGQRSAESVIAKLKPDIVWTNGDLWCFDHLLNSPNRNSFRLITYYTIDGSPYTGISFNPGQSSEWGSKLVKADRIVTMTEFGQKVLNALPELKDKKIDVIYHPMDITRFRCLNESEKREERKRLYSGHIDPNSFVIGWIGRNQFRKQNHKMWEVLHYLKHGDYIECSACNRITVKEYDWATRQSIPGRHRYEEGYSYEHCWYCKSKDIRLGNALKDVYLWQHMSRTDQGYNYPLHSKIWDIDDRVIISGSDNPSKGLTPKLLADLISTWDCFLYLTGGEGFGVPAFEALMSGVPVVYSNYSSHPDFCKHGGLPVRVGEFIPEFAFGINRSICDTGDAVRQLLYAYRNRDALKALGLKGREFALQKNVTSIANQWYTMFKELAAQPLPIENANNLYAQVI